MQRLMCRLFGHHRNTKRVRPSIDGWRSSCIFCGQYMIRVAPGEWCLIEEYRRLHGALLSLPWHAVDSGRSDESDEYERTRRAIRDLFDAERDAH